MDARDLSITAGAIKVLSAIIGLLVLLWFGVYRIYLAQDTAVQGEVRANIVHQAPRVIGTNEQLHLLCADIKTAKDLADLYRGGTDPADRANYRGATVALLDDEHRYDAMITNPDNTVGLDASLPASSAGCLN